VAGAYPFLSPNHPDLGKRRSMFSNRPRPWPTARAVAPRIGLGPLVLSLFFTSCGTSPKQTLVDSEQRRFSAQCGKDGSCVVTGTSTTEPANGDAEPKLTYALRETGRVVGICGPSRAGSTSAISDCRPLICQSDADCPPAQGLTHGVCINQLCTEPSHTIISEDAVLLCLAGTGTTPKTPLQVERLALGLNCGTPCQIPKPCHPL
jgi:hypothetical protein